jgi:hypothetical protein
MDFKKYVYVFVNPLSTTYDCRLKNGVIFINVILITKIVETRETIDSVNIIGKNETNSEDAQKITLSNKNDVKRIFETPILSTWFPLLSEEEIEKVKREILYFSDSENIHFAKSARINITLQHALRIYDYVIRSVLPVEEVKTTIGLEEEHQLINQFVKQNQWTKGGTCKSRIKKKQTKRNETQKETKHKKNQKKKETNKKKRNTKRNKMKKN